MRLLEYRNNPVNMESKLSGFLISNDPVRVFLYPDIYGSGNELRVYVVNI